MPNLESKFIILCSSKLALPAIFALHERKQVALVACYTSNIEFEEELIYHCKHHKIPFKILDKKAWKEELEEALVILKPEAVLVKTFSFKIPGKLFQLAKRGFINFHYALLPQYRGAFPLYEVLKRQEDYGGVTLHYMDDGLDTGDIIMQQYVSIKFGETYGKYEINLAQEGAKLSIMLAELLEDEKATLPCVKQDETLARTILKPRTKDLIIDWNTMSAKQIVAMILATNPWGKGALAYWKNIPVQILYARYNSGSLPEAKPGQIIELSEENGFKVACINNESISVDIVYMQEGYLPGFKFKDFGITISEIASMPKFV